MMECLTEDLAPREVITCRMSLKTKVHREIGHMFLAAQGPTKKSERLRVSASYQAPCQGFIYLVLLSS